MEQSTAGSGSFGVARGPLLGRGDDCAPRAGWFGVDLSLICIRGWRCVAVGGADGGSGAFALEWQSVAQTYCVGPLCLD